jgi:hypothetical protein
MVASRRSSFGQAAMRIAVGLTPGSGSTFVKVPSSADVWRIAFEPPERPK